MTSVFNYSAVTNVTGVSTSSSDYNKTSHGSEFDTMVQDAMASQDSAGASEAQDSEEGAPTAAQKFLEYMEKTPAERYYEMFLAQMGLTKEELADMELEDRLKIERLIEQRIEDQLEEDAKKMSVNAQAGQATQSVEQYQIPEWMAEFGMTLSDQLGATDTENPGIYAPTGGTSLEKSEYNARVRGHFEAVIAEANIHSSQDYYDQLIIDKERSNELHGMFMDRLNNDEKFLALGIKF